MKTSFQQYRSSAMGASIEWPKPTTKARRPQTKICKHYFRWPMRSNCPRCKRGQPKRRVRRFPLTQNRVRNFADQRETDRGRIVPLHIHERLDQFALIDANQFPGFPLEVPNPDISEHLKG